MTTFKKYASFQCFMAMAACIMLLALSGCGGGGSGNTPVTTSSIGAGPATSVVSGNSNGTLGMADKAAARQIVENLPYLNAVLGENVPPLSKGKYLLPAGVATVVRSSMIATREITNTFVTGMTAYVQATFTLTGTLTFKDSAGAAAGEKPVSMQSTGNYVLEKGTDGKWHVIEDATENLSFSSGKAGSITVQEVHFRPALAGPGDTQVIEAFISSSAASPELYVVAKINSLGLKVLLMDDGTNGDMVAGDGEYSGQYTIPATAAEGQYTGVLDIIEKSESFDLTQDAASAYINPYTGVVMTHAMIVGSLQSLTISSSATTVDSGGFIYFLAEGTFSNGTFVDVTNDVTWNSSDTNAGSVEGPGFFYAGAPGTTTVSATLGTLTSNSITVTVTGSVAGGGTCGDAYCDASIGETLALCPSDCGGVAGYCGDAFCDPTKGETTTTCAADCGGGVAGYCGDAYCDASIGETLALCPSDCTGGGTFGAPTNVSATAGSGQVTLSWDPVVGATSYNIYYDTMHAQSLDVRIPTFVSGSGVTKLNGIAYTGITSTSAVLTLGSENWQVTDYDPDEPMAGDPCIAAGNCYDLNPGVEDTFNNNADIFDDQVTLLGMATYYFVVTSVDASSVESSESAEVSGTPTAPALTAQKVAGGDLHSCALMSDNTVKCWGGNTNGELGNGGNTDSHTPVKVTGLTLPSEIGLGYFHSCAVDSGGLGDGTIVNSNVPVSVDTSVYARIFLGKVTQYAMRLQYYSDKLSRNMKKVQKT